MLTNTKSRCYLNIRKVLALECNGVLITRKTRIHSERRQEVWQSDTELNDRKLTILKAIIQNYLETGEPVGSRTIVQSIRN